jgi:putative transposase
MPGCVITPPRKVQTSGCSIRKLALWRYDYNNVRPHSSLGNKTPAEARRELEQSEGSAPAALATPETDH